VYELPTRLNLETIQDYPSQRFDFWYLEYLFHQNLLASEYFTASPDDADFFLVPFYPACFLAAFAYDRGVNLAQWTRLQRYRSEWHVHFGFRESMRIVRSQPSWKRLGWRRHLFVFGQGRGANSGFFWKFFGRQVKDCTFLGVEASPFGNPSAFRVGHDVVIPGFTPWQDVIDEVRAEHHQRNILLHFRGRPWGKVRKHIFRHIPPAQDTLVEADSPYALGGENRCANRMDAREYFRELHRSVFCLCPAGWTPWSKRIYESILCGAIPVLIPGTFVPPFRSQIDYTQCSVTITMAELPRLQSILRSLSADRVKHMLMEVDRVRQHFIWHERSVKGDAFDLVMQDLADAISD
jgi:hypothetical protein